MLENIRKIGLFMIAAQAVIHFAPSGQYEKYIKLVSSVIILFMFMRPFVSSRIDLKEEWGAEIDQIREEFMEEDLWQAEEKSIDSMVLEQLETEIKSRLNNSILGEMYRVDSVSLIFDGDGHAGVDGGYDLQFQKAEIIMTKKDEEEIEPILVEDILIGEVQKEGRAEDLAEDTGAALRYRETFAGVLGIEPDRVEVICVGGW